MKIRLTSIEDGIDNVSFRKVSAYIKSIHQDTSVVYIPPRKQTEHTKGTCYHRLENAKMVVQYLMQ